MNRRARILPFRLTEGQRGALKEIVEDMQRTTPMNRLLQGDVGAGKTIVALLAALVAMENGLQVAFMAPTEILAEQHFLSLRKLLETIALSRRAHHRERRAGLRRRDLLARLAAGDDSSRRRHACAGAGYGEFPVAGARHHRRTASLRRHSARDASVEGPDARRAGDDGHADSANARADGVWRSRRLGRSATCRPAAVRF